MKEMFVVVIANNSNTDIELSEPFLEKKAALSHMVACYQDAVDRFFEDPDCLGPEDEKSFTEEGFTVYESKSRDLEYGKICQIKMPANIAVKEGYHASEMAY